LPKWELIGDRCLQIDLTLGGKLGEDDCGERLPDRSGFVERFLGRSGGSGQIDVSVATGREHAQPIGDGEGVAGCSIFLQELAGVGIDACKHAIEVEIRGQDGIGHLCHLT